MRRAAFVVALLGVWAVAVSQPPKEVTLRLRYQPGQTLVYEVGLDGKVTVVSEIGVATDLQFRGRLRQEQQVEAVAEDGTATLLVTVSGTVQVDMGGNPAPGTPAAQQSNEMGVPPTRVRVKVTPTGRIVEMRPVPTEGAPAEKKDAAPPFMQDPFQALTLGTGAMSLLPALLPEKPVKVGDTWDLTGTAEVPLPSGRSAPVALKGSGKLLAVQTENDHPVAVMEVRIEVPDLGEVIAKALPLKEMGVDLQAKGGTKAVGKHWYDLAAGVVARSEVTTESQIATLIRMPENTGGGVLSLQSRTTLKTTMRLVEVKAAKP